MATSVPTYNFTWQQGEDGLVYLVRQTGNPPVPINLTGYKVRMDIRNGAGTLLYTFNSDDIVETPSVDQTGPSDNEAVLGEDGSIKIVIPRSASLGSGPLVAEVGNILNYDIFLRDTSNHQKKILRGTITLEASVTRWT